MHRKKNSKEQAHDRANLLEQQRKLANAAQEFVSDLWDAEFCPEYIRIGTYSKLADLSNQYKNAQTQLSETHVGDDLDDPKWDSQTSTWIGQYVRLNRKKVKS